MKPRSLDQAQVREMIAEVRAMALLSPGTNAKALARAKHLRFQVQGQDWTPPYVAGKLNAAYRDLEVLLSPRRWRSVPSLEGLRKDIKSACSLALSALN